MLKVGRISYANCTPLFYLLRTQEQEPVFELVTGVPADLNGRLYRGEIDVCPSSSIEYAYHHDRYSILPELAIASSGEVASVLLFSPVPVTELDGREVELSAESATSVNLLKILLKQRYGCSCTFQIAKPESTGQRLVKPLLLIGDAALQRSFRLDEGFVYDLGKEWFDWTGYPFVFALWLCRKEIAAQRELQMLALRLLNAKQAVSDRLEEIVSTAEELHWMGKDKLLEYWQKNISYQLDERAQSGLMLYYTKCYELGLIASVPHLDFVRLQAGEKERTHGFAHPSE